MKGTNPRGLAFTITTFIRRQTHSQARYRSSNMAAATAVSKRSAMVILTARRRQNLGSVFGVLEDWTRPARRSKSSHAGHLDRWSQLIDNRGITTVVNPNAHVNLIPNSATLHVSNLIDASQHRRQTQYLSFDPSRFTSRNQLSAGTRWHVNISEKSFDGFDVRRQKNQSRKDERWCIWAKFWRCKIPKHAFGLKITTPEDRNHSEITELKKQVRHYMEHHVNRR